MGQGCCNNLIKTLLFSLYLSYSSISASTRILKKQNKRKTTFSHALPLSPALNLPPSLPATHRVPLCSLLISFAHNPAPALFAFVKRRGPSDPLPSSHQLENDDDEGGGRSNSPPSPPLSLSEPEQALPAEGTGVRGQQHARSESLDWSLIVKGCVVALKSTRSKRERNGRGRSCWVGGGCRG